MSGELFRFTSANSPESALTDPPGSDRVSDREITDTVHYLAICTDDGEPRLELVCTAAPGSDCRKRPKDAEDREYWYAAEVTTTCAEHPHMDRVDTHICCHKQRVQVLRDREMSDGSHLVTAVTECRVVYQGKLLEGM